MSLKKCHQKCASDIGLALHEDVSSIKQSNLLHNGKPKSAAEDIPGLFVPDSEKFSKELTCFLGCHPNAGVRHAKDHSFVLRFDPNLYASSLAIVFDGIGEQVVENDFYLPAIGGHRDRRVSVEIDGDIPFSCLR